MSWSADHEAAPAPPDTTELSRSYVRVFADNDGQAVLDDLRKLSIDRAWPGCTDAELRHLEGKRDLCRYIINQIERGARS